MLLRYHLPPLLWVLAIFASSSIPSEQLPPLPIVGFDKLLHAVTYCILCWLLHRSFALHQGRRFFLGSSLAASVIAASLYGVTDELHQLFVPGRSATIYDAAANVLGAGLYGLIARLRRKG